MGADDDRQRGREDERGRGREEHAELAGHRIAGVQQGGHLGLVTKLGDEDTREHDQVRFHAITLAGPGPRRLCERYQLGDGPMPYTPHVEQHFTAGLMVRDAVIGLSDGLTVPFALAAGLTGAVDSTAVVVTAGLAEIVAGSIAMGLGGYLAGQSDVEHYLREREREEPEIEQKPDLEAMEVV